MYYIYHIPGVKIGCSTQPKLRVEKQGYNSFEILETHNDIFIASEREIQLQKQYGYKVDTKPYFETIKIAPIGGKACIKNRKNNKEQWKKSLLNWQIAGGLKQGSIQGKKNAESGHISALGKKMVEFNNRIRTCPHCNTITRGIGYARWHGDKCKNKPNP